MSKSKIEQLILNKSFSYLQPYFYNNEFALRCKLGIGEDWEYMSNANKRALEIYNILFHFGADAIIFDYWIFDYSDFGVADPEAAETIDNAIENEARQLKFLLEYQSRYRHISVRNLAKLDDWDDEFCIRNRIVCYSDGKGFDYIDLIERQISEKGYNISFISFQNECILSVYDDRGCDIVFSDKEKMKEFYNKLKPYFLEYDLDEMERRFNS